MAKRRKKAKIKMDKALKRTEEPMPMEKSL